MEGDMDHDPRTVLQSLRALVPARGLQHHEAQGIAERQATRLLTILDQREPPVDVGLIAELPRIEVRVVPNRDLAGLSGMSQWLKKESRWLIAVNRDDSQTRRRFTLGHEFKHILDNPFINVLYPKSEYASQSADDRAERMCDYFAACLLMPRSWVKREWARGNQDAERLATIFNTSPAAMDRRLQDIGLIQSRQRWRGETESDSVRSYFRAGVMAMAAA
jgi:Zn-dependent peptidase ImmA (M78 family)